MTKIPVTRLNRTRDKVTRASEAQPWVEQGKLHLPIREDGRLQPEMEAIRDEMVGFPASEHDDTVDAVVDLLEHARKYRYDPKHTPTLVRDPMPKLWRLYGRT